MPDSLIRKTRSASPRSLVSTGAGGGSQHGHDDHVVDADFEEVDDKKRGQG